MTHNEISGLIIDIAIDMTYLRLAGNRLRILLNFGEPTLRVGRKITSSLSVKHQ